MSLKKLLKSFNNADSPLLVSPRFEQYLATHPNILVDEKVADFIRSELVTPQRDRRMTFSASSRGACPREQVFQFTSVKPVPRTNSSLYAIFHQGTFMHLKWQALLLDAGILSDPEVKCEWAEYNMTGTIDGVGEVPGSLADKYSDEFFGWELKSINDRGYSWVINNGPNQNHLLQIHAYMAASGIDLWSLCYENKNNQEWVEFVIRKDDEIVERVREELGSLNGYVERKELPPILDECSKKQGKYKSCPFAADCLEQTAWPEIKEEVAKISRRIRL